MVEKEKPIDIRPLLTEDFKVNFEKKWRLNADGCWIWTAARDKDDYGQVAVGTERGRIRRAHRVSYMLYNNADIPEGMDIDHTCHMRRCVNPEHLELVTHAENMKNLRKVNDWVDNEEEFAERNRKTSPEIILADAITVLNNSRVEEKGGGYSVVSAEGAPWRDIVLKDGFIDSDKMSRVKMFLNVVKLGVDWQAAAKNVLGVSSFTVYDWSANSDWKQDFTEAKKEGRRNRYNVLEDLHLDEMERKIDFADFKDVADSLKKLRDGDEDRIAIKKGQESNSGMPNITIVLGNSPEKALRALVEMGDEIEAEFKVVEPIALKEADNA